MPIFEIEANGKAYEVDAPTMTLAVEAIGQPPARTDTGPPQQMIMGSQPPINPMAGVRQQAQEYGPIDAGMISAGRGADRIMEGAQDAYGLASSFGQPAGSPARQLRTQRASTQADNSRLFAPLADEHPISTALGGSTPYMAAGGAGALLRKGAVMSNVIAPTLAALTEYGTPQEKLMRGGITAIAGLGANALARTVGGKAITVEDPYLKDTIKRAQDLGFYVKPSAKTRDPGLQVYEAAIQSNPRTSHMMGNVEEGNKRRLAEISAQAMGLKKEDRLSPGILDKAARFIGAKFEALKGSRFMVGEDYAREMARIHNDYIVGPGRSASKAANIIDDMTRNMDEPLTTDRYLKWTSTLAQDAEKARGAKDAGLAKLYDDARDALDTAFDDFDGDLPTLREARSQWRAYLTIRDATNEAGDVSALKLASKFRKDVGYKLGRRESDLFDAVRFANIFPNEFGRSGTAERLQGLGKSRLASMRDSAGSGALIGYPFGLGKEGAIAGAVYGGVSPELETLKAALYTSPLLNRGLVPLSQSGQSLLGRGVNAAALGLLSPQLQATGLPELTR